MKKLLVNKGYTQIHKGEYGTDIYLAIEPLTGAICLIVATEGSQYFKEMVLADTQVEFMFNVGSGEVPTSFGYVPSKTSLGKYLLREDFKTVYRFEKEVVTDVVRANEAFVRYIKEEELLSLAKVAYVNETLADISIINLTIEEVHIICDYLAGLYTKAKEAEEAAKNAAEKKEEEK